MMKKEDIQDSVLFDELEALANQGMLEKAITPDDLTKALSPEALREWNQLYEACTPSPVAKAAGLTNYDILNHLIQEAQITKGASSEEEKKARLQLYNEVLLLGKGKDIDRYDETPRKIRCVSRGYRFDRAKEWEMTQNMVTAIEQKLRSDNRPFPETLREEAIDMLMEEPEAEDLIIGETYTLLDILPDIPYSNEKPSHIGLVFLEEIHSVPKEYLDYPDGGFHSRLFEELNEVSIKDRVKHYDEYISKLLAQ